MTFRTLDDEHPGDFELESYREDGHASYVGATGPRPCPDCGATEPGLHARGCTHETAPGPTAQGRLRLWVLDHYRDGARRVVLTAFKATDEDTLRERFRVHLEPWGYEFLAIAPEGTYPPEARAIVFGQ